MKLKYLQNSKVIVYRPKKKNFFLELEVIINAREVLGSIKQIVTADLLNVAKTTGQDPGVYVDYWFNYADILLLARRKGEVCGFCIANILKDRLFYFPATMIIPKYQSMGLGKFILSKTMQKCLFLSIKRSKHKFWPFFRYFYFIFRTQNPFLYEMLSHKNINIFPSIMGTSRPSQGEIKLAEEGAAKIWPNCGFESSNFVLKNAYINTPNLILDPSNIPWASDQLINNYFQKNLDLTNRGSNALLIMGKVGITDKLKILLGKF